MKLGSYTITGTLGRLLPSLITHINHPAFTSEAWKTLDLAAGSLSVDFPWPEYGSGEGRSTPNHTLTIRQAGYINLISIYKNVDVLGTLHKN